MQTSKFFSIALIAAAAAVSSSGAFANDSEYPGVKASPTAGTLTRAQVRAEYLQAKREGTLQQTDDRYPVLLAEDTGKSRAEVKQALAEAHRDGYSVRVDNSYPAMEAGS